MELQYSPSVARNKEPILEQLQKYIEKNKKLLEIGSGTGEHAVFFGKLFPQLKWTTSDDKSNHPYIKQWLKHSGLKNVTGPAKLRVGIDDFPKDSFNYVFTANTLHIMSWKEAKTLFKLLGKRLREKSLVFIYGPFNYNGDFTSESNRAFDASLKSRNSLSGIRNFEDVNQAMIKSGFELLEDHEMPANNRFLVFERLPFKK